MMSLSQFGIPHEGLHPCMMFDGRILVPASHDGVPCCFILDTARRDRIVLDLPYALDRGIIADFAGSRPSAVYGGAAYDIWKTLPATIEVLGITVENEPFRAANLGIGTLSTPIPVAGVVGVGLFLNGILAVDVKGGIAAYSASVDRDTLGGQASAVLELDHASGQVISATQCIRDDATKGKIKPFLMLSTAARHSWLTADYPGNAVLPWIRRLAIEYAYRSRRAIRWPFSLPNGRQLYARVGFLPSLSTYAEEVAVERIDGILGLDVLGRWVCIFSYRDGLLFIAE